MNYTNSQKRNIFTICSTFITYGLLLVGCVQPLRLDYLFSFTVNEGVVCSYLHCEDWVIHPDAMLSEDSYNK